MQTPIGTVNSRLSRGRRLLRSQLERRGVVVPSARFSANWLAGTTTTVAVPLLESTIAAAIGSATAKAVPALVLSLIHGVLKTMWLRKVTTNVLAVVLIGAGREVSQCGPTGLRQRPRSLPQGLGLCWHWLEKTPTSSPGTAYPLQHVRSRKRIRRRRWTRPEPLDGPEGTLDGLPADCPISIAAGALSKMIDQFHQPSQDSP